MVAESTHPSLLCRVKDPNDQQAWREFESRYARLLLRYAQGRGLQRMDAEDVRQLVLLKLAHALRSFEYDPDRGRFRDYLGRVVRNAILSQALRPTRGMSAVGFADAAGVPEEADAADATWDREWMLHHFHLAMRTVRVTFDPKSLEMFDRVLTGEPPDRVAHEFGVTRDAVYKVKQRIRERLKELVRQQIDDEEFEEPLSPADPRGPEAPELAAFGFDDPAESWIARVRESEQADDLGTVGRFELLEEVSRGGQGIVFRARHLESGREIALKRLLAGAFATAAMRRRFEREVEATAALDHPNVVRVLGMEHVDGMPLLAMEWIDGVPITAWAASDGRRRPVAELLRVFLDVCDAVHHAHQHGVLHRDLKPSNILVDAKGAAHVLDFGMAKFGPAEADPIAAPLTLSGELVGTPAYASPEQVAGNAATIDVRSDVYALGVILFEVLTGQSPYGPRTSVHALLDAVASSVPPPPSAVNPAVDFDLDTIAAKALAKDRRDRYASVGALADDVRANLAGLPIAAQPPTSFQQMLRTVRRHGFAFAFALTVFLLTLAFLVYALLQAGRLERQRDAARLEARRAEEIKTFFLDDVLMKLDLRNPLRVSNLDELFDHGLERVHQRFADEPAIESAILRTMGELAKSQGKYARAEEMLRKAHELNAALPDADPNATALTTLSLGRVLLETQGPDQALPLLESAVDLLTEHEELDRGVLAVALNDLGIVHFRRGDLAAAERATLASVELVEKAIGVDARLGLVLSNLSRVYLLQARYAEAEDAARRSDALLQAHLPSGHPSLGMVQTRLGSVLWRKGDVAAAEEHLRRGLSLQEQVLGPEHPDVTSALYELAQFLIATGRAEEGQPLADRALRARHENR